MDYPTLPDHDEALLTTGRVAVILAVGPETVRRLIRRGSLPAVNLHGPAGYRIRAGDVRAYLTAGRRLGRAFSHD